MDWVESLLTFWTPSRPRMGPAPATAREAFQDFDSRIVSAPRQRARDTVLDDLIEANIAPFFVAPSGEPPEISLGPPGEERNRRQSRYVRFLSGEGLGGCVVVKGAWKRLAWFRKANRVVRYRNAANVHALLQTRGVEIPRLLFRCDGGRGFSRMQFHLIAEDLVSGRPLRPGNVEDCRAAARTLAKMHAIVRGDAGGVWQGVVPRERYPHRQILPRVRRYVRLIEREAPTAEISFFGERTGGWFWSRTVDLLDLGAPFSLCHGDVSERNVLIEDSKATLLDFTSSLFGLAGFDLIKAYANWGGGDAEATRAFAESYFESVPEEHWKWFSSGFDMFAAMLALKFLYQHFRTGGDKYGNFSSRRLAEAASRSMQGTFEPPASVGDSVDRFLKLFFGDASAQ